MRTESQIKRKLNEYDTMKRSLEARISEARAAAPAQEELIRSLESQKAHLEDLAALLEWVLNEPLGKYHA
jgi:predicted nuclease with TOPRIM domain